MPELTGVPILDVFIWIAAVFAAAATMGTAVMKWLEVLKGKKKDRYGRRRDDVEKLRDKVDGHGERLVGLETEVENLSDGLSDVKKGQETQRKESREDFKAVFRKLDAIHDGVTRNGNSDD